ncbi:MAG TPA: glycoside hydrolase family 16 protein [Bryobacteraceae bacterium]|nr:glycoside hydrolase family 16 protein [Bryobacteraceae bacterium]
MPRTVPGLKAILIAAAVLLSLAGCRSVHADGQPSIEFSRIPEAGDGSPVKVEAIEGRVKGARPGERIVVFALSGVWWVQPLGDQPFTAIQPDSTWKTSTHPGSAYAALLVDSRYHPPLRINALPEKGGPVLAIATVAGALPRVPLKTIQFSGYQWEVRENSYDAGGTRNYFDRRNAWTDSQGLLHLRIARQGQRWTSAEVKLTRSLGYGSYRFVVRDVAHLEPGAVCAIFTWDDLGPSREMEIEISRWGEPEDQNAQYVIQPYVVPANTVRFNAPSGTLTHWIDWQPGRVTFKTVTGKTVTGKTVRGSSSTASRDAVNEHVFTSGIPSPGSERIHINHYVYNNRRNPLQHESEVIIEKFEFLP